MHCRGCFERILFIFMLEMSSNKLVETDSGEVQDKVSKEMGLTGKKEQPLSILAVARSEVVEILQMAKNMLEVFH